MPVKTNSETLVIKWLSLQVLSVFQPSMSYRCDLALTVNGILYGLMASFVLTMAWILLLFKVYRHIRSLTVNEKFII